MQYILDVIVFFLILPALIPISMKYISVLVDSKTIVMNDSVDLNHLKECGVSYEILGQVCVGRTPFCASCSLEKFTDSYDDVWHYVKKFV